jgi:hypothetical protein
MSKLIIYICPSITFKKKENMLIFFIFHVSILDIGILRLFLPIQGNFLVFFAPIYQHTFL